MPSEHHPHSGRIMGDLSLPLVMPPGTVIWPLKRSLWGCFHRRNSQFFWSAGLVTARGFCVILEGAAPTTSPPRTGNEPER